jgi:hypothetical protein
MWTRHHIKNTQEPNSLNFCGGGPKESLLGRKESVFIFYFTAFFMLVICDCGWLFFSAIENGRPAFKELGAKVSSRSKPSQ